MHLDAFWLFETKQMSVNVFLTRRFKNCGRVHGGHHHGEGLQTLKCHAYGGHQHVHPGSEKVKQALPFICPPHDVDPLGALATSDPG